MVFLAEVELKKLTPAWEDWLNSFILREQPLKLIQIRPVLLLLDTTSKHFLGKLNLERSRILVKKRDELLQTTWKVVLFKNRTSNFSCLERILCPLTWSSLIEHLWYYYRKIRWTLVTTLNIQSKNTCFDQIFFSK